MKMQGRPPSEEGGLPRTPSTEDFSHDTAPIRRIVTRQLGEGVMFL